MSDKVEKKEKKKKEKRGKEGKNNNEGEAEAKQEGKEKKGRERRSRVSFLHERQTAPPPPRYAVGEEPPLPAFPITWSPIAVCVETSLPGFSRDALMEVLNTVGRPAVSMSVIHPLDLAEDEMRVEGTQLATELVTAKMEGKVPWPPANLLTKCLRSRSALDRNEEHRLEETRRGNLVFQAKKATEDARAAVLVAGEGVKAAETLLKEYRVKLKEDRIREVTAQRLAARAAKEAEAAAAAAGTAQDAEAADSGKKTKKGKKEKKEQKGKEKEKAEKDDSVKKEQNLEKKEDKSKKEKGKGKKGKGKSESEPVPEILLSPREQWRILEEGIARAKDVVSEAEIQVEVCLDNEARVEAALNDSFSTGHVYCLLGLDSALPIAELCAQKNGFFRGVLNVALKPKVPLILPESSGPSTPLDDDAVSVTSTSTVSSSKSADPKKKKKSRKEAKAAAKAAKVEAAVSAVPLLVSEIRSLKETCILSDPLRQVAVVDVFYEPAPPPELDFSELGSKDQGKEDIRGMMEEGSQGEEQPREKKKEKKEKKKKGDTEVKTEEGGKKMEKEEKMAKKEKKEKKEKKGKEGKEGRRGSKRGDSTLPYKEIAQAVIAACQRLQTQVELYNQMGGDTCRVFSVPAAKPMEEVDSTYYKRLISEVPPGLVSVPIIVHCLVEQVAAYSWPVEDIKALEVANENKRLRRGMEEAFKKLGHPKWIGVDKDTSSNLAKRFEMLYNFSQKDTAQSLPPDTNERMTGEKHSESMPGADSKETHSLNSDGFISKITEAYPTKGETTTVVEPKLTSGSPGKAETDAKKSKQGDSHKTVDRDPVSDFDIPPEHERKESDMIISGDMHVSATCGDCIMHEAVTGTCAVHHDHVDMGDEVELRKPETPEEPYDPFANPKDLEERLNVTHEFDTVSRMLLNSKPHRPQFTNSVDVAKVEEHMSKVRATAGRGRKKMPVKPEYSEEKMGATLTALQDLCEKYEEPRFAISDEEAIFNCAEHLAAHPPSPAVPLQTLQRYKKLTTFFEMVKEDKLMLPDLDVPIEEPPKEPDLDPQLPVESVDPPDLSPAEMEDWCGVCRRIFSQPSMRAKLPKLMPPPPERPSIRHRASVVERKSSLVEIVQDKRKSLALDQNMFGLDRKTYLSDEPESKPEENELGMDSPTLEELELAERHYDTDPGLDPKVVKSWCPVCARIFAVPTPPDLQAVREEGERMRLEMERLAREEAEAIVAAKIAAWERRKEKLRESIIDRRHAEGFADGLMGEVYAKAKLYLPFEMLRYDRDEDCVLTVLYAADGERTFEEEIPIYVPFGDFCLEDVSKLGPIKRRREAYELETRFRSIHDKRRYLLTEDGGLVVCGLPSMSHIQYEPRTTVFKDGIVVTLRASEKPYEGKPGKEREDKVDDGSPPKEAEEGAKPKRKKGGSRDPSPHPNKEVKASSNDENDKPGKERVKKEKSKRKKGEEQDAKTTTESAPVVTEATSLIAGLVPNAVRTSGSTSSEKQRTVMAFLVDGVIVCFFFAKDGTLSLQVNNPSGRTFELTSSGVVVFLPVESQKDEPPATTAAPRSPRDLSSGTLPLPKDEEKEGKVKKNGKGTPERSSPPEKDGDKEEKPSKKGDIAQGSPKGEKGEKEKKKRKGESKDGKVAKETETGKRSKKEKGGQEDNIPGAETEVADATSAVALETKRLLTSDVQFLSKVYEEKQGEMEISRCILPTGSVVSYKKNGQIQILLNDGNVSEYVAVPEKAAIGKTTSDNEVSSEESFSPEKAFTSTFGWHTINNKGLAAVKLSVPNVIPLKMESTPPSLNSEEKKKKKTVTESKGKGGKEIDKGKDKEKEDAAGKEEGKIEGKEKGKKKASKEKVGKRGTRHTDGPENKTQSPVFDDSISSGIFTRTPEIPVPGDALHVVMPSKKVTEMYDPDSGSSILTREDLVIVVRTDDQGIRVVQHADGTHIYSEIVDVTPSYYEPSRGKQMIDDIKVFSANATLPTLCRTSSRKVPGIAGKEIEKIQMSSGPIQTPNLGSNGGSKMGVAHSEELMEEMSAKVEVEPEHLSTPPAPEVPSLSSDIKSVAGNQVNVAAAPRLHEADKSRVLCTSQWHVRKDGFPNVQGNTKGGVAVEFSTAEGQYCGTWSKESGQLSLLMPNGSMLYSCGKLVYFDPSDGAKKADPKQRIHDQLTKGQPFINTNGLYEFNLEKASLSFTDNVGNGFRTNWGFKVDPIKAGKLPEPPQEATIGCGIEGPVGNDKPFDSLSFTQDVPLSGETREELANASVGKADSKAKGEGTRADRKSKTAAVTKTDPDSKASGSKNFAVAPALKENKKGDISKAGKTHVPDSEDPAVVGQPLLSPIRERHDLEADSVSSISDAGPGSCASTASGPVSVDRSQEEIPEDPFLGPYPRLFVIHEGGFGFEILHEDDFQKYAYSKVFRKECTRVKENYAESDVVLHTFVTVEQKAKKLAELEMEKHEGCRAPDSLKLWTKRVPEFARRIKFRAVLSKMQKRTQCDWLQLSLELPCLPRAVAPEILPVMPLSNVTNIMFRQIFEYSPFELGVIRKMDKILKIYKEWQDSSMILRDVEVIPDERTLKEKKKAEEIAQRIREGVAEQKLQEARERAAIEVQHAAQIFRILREKELESLEEFERLKRNMQAESLRQWQLYTESKKGRIPCRHEVCHLFQKKKPFRPPAKGALLYFHCEEGLEFMYRLSFYRRPPPGPRRWSVETTPPRSEQGLDVFAEQKSGLGSDVGMDAYDLPDRQPSKEEMVVEPVHPETCIFEEWMKEEPKQTGEAEVPQDEGLKLCWEVESHRKPKREIAPANWTPCFMEGFEMESACKPKPEEAEKFEEQEFQKKPVRPYVSVEYYSGDSDESSESAWTPLLPRTQEPQPEREADSLPPLPELPSFWQAPMGTDWQIDNEAVQYQLELLPSRPGWVKAEWRKNKKYLDLNMPTMLNMQISSVARLKLREKPPIDWAHQFLLVPEYLDYGAVEYGTISMKVAFLQNYHGTNCGRFRFEDLGPCCRILCEYGMVPPGLYRVLRVFFRADRLGKFEHQIKVITQYDIFTLPIYANVVRPKSYDESQRRQSCGTSNPENVTWCLDEKDNGNV